jgi:hypothetical protein
MKGLLEKKWVKTLITVLCCIAAVYALIYVDVILRARSAYMEGEKYFSWYKNPELKAQVLNAEFEKEKAKLDKKLSKGKVTQDDYNKELDIAKFDTQQKLGDSSIKYAYVWYQTVVELFSPPESKWVKLSREKMPVAKELWKKELTQKGIPFEDYMLE